MWQCFRLEARFLTQKWSLRVKSQFHISLTTPVDGKAVPLTQHGRLGVFFPLTDTLMAQGTALLGLYMHLVTSFTQQQHWRPVLLSIRILGFPYLKHRIRVLGSKGGQALHCHRNGELQDLRRSLYSRCQQPQREREKGENGEVRVTGNRVRRLSRYNESGLIYFAQGNRKKFW